MTQSKLTRNLLSLLLSVALMFTTLPVTAVAEDGQALGYSGETATSGVTLDGETPPDETETEDGIEAATPGNTNPTDDNIPLGYSVVAFAELSDEVKNQSVPFGTALEDLALPDSLDATVSDGEDEADTTIEGVTWQSAPEYAAVTIGALEFVPAGTYVFTSVLPEGYTLSEAVDLPVITVELQPMGIVAASGIVDITAMSGEIVITEPTTLTGTNPDVWVVVKSTTGIDVTLSNLNITIPLDAQHSPMKIVGKANITLVGDNTLDASAVTVADFAVAGLEVAGFEASDNNEVTIDGDGSLTAKGGQCGAGICNGFYEDPNGTITIKSGTIIAAGGQYGAGIGGGGYSEVGGFSGKLTIDGGTITAYGGMKAAGIGGGGGNFSASGSYGGFGGTTIINNGIVTAFGGGGNSDSTVVAQGGGAGIGGGGASDSYSGSGFGGGSGIIIINGGVVTATGAGGGAGIGGGSGGENGDGGIGETITITGGYVNATGSFAGMGSGAGIGGGGGGMDGLSRGGSGGTITISGGEIIATSTGFPAAAIGGGGGYMAGGDWGNITISNGVDPVKITITNIGSSNTKIGSGCGYDAQGVIPGEDAPNLYTVTFHGYGGTTQQLMFCHTEPGGGSYATLPTAEYLTMLNPDFFGGNTPETVAWAASSTATAGKAAGKSFNPASSANYYLVSGIAGDGNTFDVSNSTGQLTIEEVSATNTIKVYDSDDIISEDIPITETITLTGTNPNVWVVVKSTTGIDVALSGLNITIPSTAQHSPMRIEGKANITLEGDNTLDASATDATAFKDTTYKLAGLEVSYGNEVTIGAIDDKNDESGKLTTKGGYGGPGIGGCLGNGTTYNYAGGVITINSGTIIATGGLFAAGINGGTNRDTTSNSDKSTVTINGGKITAIGGDFGAGIGGNHNRPYQNGTVASGCDGGIITIYGGTVTASGGKSGAGIGGGGGNKTGTNGIPGTGGTITIYGGNVIATGYTGAGIGGGGDDGLTFTHTGGHGGTITITGGNIYAASAQKTGQSPGNGAGIGGGGSVDRGGNSGDINISGGVIAAKGSLGIGAGMGYGDEDVPGRQNKPGDINSITITGGIDPAKIDVLGSYVKIGAGIYNSAPNLYTVTFHGDGGTTQELMFCHTEPNSGSYAKLPTAEYLTMLNPDFFGGSTPAVVAWTASSTATTGKAAGKSFNPASSADYYLVSGIAGDDNTFDVSNSTGQLTIEEVSGSPDNTITVYDSDDIIAEDITITETITLTGTNPNVWVVVKSTTGAKVKLDDLNITIPSTAQHSPMKIEGKANITLEGNNTLDASAVTATTNAVAGLEVIYGNDEVTINGSGSLTAKGGQYGAGIGSGIGGYGGGTITIESGTINATGGEYAAGIGGGGHLDCSGDGGYLTINGGTITATGGNRAAGIGGGSASKDIGLDGLGVSGGHGGTIIINGGTVTAVAVEGFYYGGAGIGGGGSNGRDNAWGGDGGSITINGGTVSATGVQGGAGIGGGGGGNIGGYSGTITITGGYVNATGTKSMNPGRGGAGIGGGGGGFDGWSHGGAVEIITISGGEVIATSTGYAAAIGGGGSVGSGGWVGNITISSGVDPAKITANGSDCVKIGSGWGYGLGATTPGEDAANLYTVTFHGYGGTKTQQLMFCRTSGNGSYATLPTAEYLTMLNPDFFSNGLPATVKWATTADAETGTAAGGLFDPSVSQDYYLLKQDMSGSITFSNPESVTYNGSEHAPQGATIDHTAHGTGSWTYTYAVSSGGSLNGNGKPVGAGTYTVTAKYADNTCQGKQTATFIINKASQTPPATPTLNTKDATSITLNTISGAEYKVGTGAWQTSPEFTGLTPGTAYTFYAYYPADDNHNASSASSATISTDMAALGGEVTISGTTRYGETLTAVTTGLTMTPNGTLGTFSYQWKRGGADISGAINSTYVLQNADIGQTITVTVTAANCTGSVTSDPTSAVDKRTVVIGDLSYSLPANVDYNGSPQSVSVTASGKTGFGVITVKYDSGTTAPTTAGDYTITVSIAEGANYAATTADITLGTFTINTKALSDSMIGSIAVQNYTGGAITPEPAIMDGQMPLTKGTDFDYSYTNNTNAGTATLTITGKGNYSSSASKDFTINGIDIPAGNITVTPYSGTYNSSAHSISVTDSGSGTVTYCATETGTYTATNPTYTNAGTYTVYFKVNRGGNYNEYSDTSTVTITQAPLTITAATISPKTYDGTTTATVTGVIFSGNVGTLALGTDFTATGVFNSANAGTGKTVIVTVTLGSTALADNHSLSVTTCSLQNQSIAQATGIFGSPAAIDTTYTTTLTLANLTLPAGYTWDTPSTALSAGNSQSFPVKYNNPNGNYTEATGNITVNVAKANQAVLTVDAVTGKIFGNADFQLTTSGGSGTGAVSFTLVSGPATLTSGGMLTITGAGNIVVNATKAGDTNYNGSATSANRTITIAKAPAPTISWPTATTITYGAALSTSALTPASNAYGSFAWTNGATAPTVTNSGYSVTFTPSAATLQNYEPISPLTQTVSITVNKATTTGVPQIYEVLENTVQNYSFDLTRLLPNVNPLSLGTVTYEIKAVTNTDVLSTEPSGTVTSPLSLNVANVAAGKTATITVTVHSGNYNDFDVDITVNSVNKIPVTITGVNMTGGVYKGSGYAYSGTPIFTPTAGGTAVTISPFDVLYESTDSGGHNSATAPTNAGAYKLTLSVPSTNATYTGSTVFTFTITQKQVTVKADDKSAKVDGTLPTPTVSYTGFVGTDNVSNALTTQAVAQHTAADTQTAGTFPINITTDAVLNATNGANYTLSHQNGTLTVTSFATFTITATAGSNGSISPSGAVLVTEGDSRTFTVSANNGYHISSVTVDGVNKGAVSSYTFTNVTGNHTISASFTANSTGGSSGGSGGGSGGSGGGTTTTTTTPPAETWLEQNPAGTLANGANSTNEDNARTTSNGAYGVRATAWAKLAGLRFEHDTMDGNAVQVRLYINSPETITKDMMVSGYVKGTDVDYARNTFEKYFDNRVRTIHFDQQDAWGQPVNIAARVDLTLFDTKKLYFYDYDKKTNIYRRIEKPAYWIDKNGYLHFTTEYAGDIIISENPLEKK